MGPYDYHMTLTGCLLRGWGMPKSSKANVGSCFRTLPHPKLQNLPRPFYVVPFWVVYNHLYPKTRNKPKKELHRSFWVDPHPLDAPSFAVWCFRTAMASGNGSASGKDLECVSFRV